MNNDKQCRGWFITNHDIVSIYNLCKALFNIGCKRSLIIMLVNFFSVKSIVSSPSYITSKKIISSLISATGIFIYRSLINVRKHIASLGSKC